RSLTVGTAPAKQFSAMTENICCSPPRAISSRPSATKNLQTCIATCSAFISSHWLKKRRTRWRLRAMKSGRLKKNDKKKKQKRPKGKSRRRRRAQKNRKKSQRSPWL